MNLCLVAVKAPIYFEDYSIAIEPTYLVWSSQNFDVKFVVVATRTIKYLQVMKQHLRNLIRTRDYFEFKAKIFLMIKKCQSTVVISSNLNTFATARIPIVAGQTLVAFIVTIEVYSFDQQNLHSSNLFGL